MMKIAGQTLIVILIGYFMKSEAQNNACLLISMVKKCGTEEHKMRPMSFCVLSSDRITGEKTSQTRAD
jgi:hypothetical protein